MRERTIRMSGCGLAAALGVGILLAAGSSVDAQRITPATPGAAGDPVWTRVLRLSDGRMFVTDGGLAIDAALAKPAAMPIVVLPESSAKVIEGYLAAPLKDEFALAQLTANPNGRTFVSPSGLLLNATYVNFLRRVLPTRTLRFRMEAELQPMVIMSDGKAVGVLMGVRK